MPTKITFVGVKEAAEAWGVSPNTIRAWGASGKLIEHRHPVNNYRLYKAKDLERLVAKLHRPDSPKKPR